MKQEETLASPYHQLWHRILRQAVHLLAYSIPEEEGISKHFIRRETRK